MQAGQNKVEHEAQSMALETPPPLTHGCLMSFSMHLQLPLPGTEGSLSVPARK